MSNDQRNTIESSALEAADFEVAETKPEGVVEIALLSSPLRGAIIVPCSSRRWPRAPAV